MIARTIESLKAIKSALSLERPIKTETISPDNKMVAALLLDKGFYQSCRVEVVAPGIAGKNPVYIIENYPITEFQSILSIINPMIPKLEFFEKSPKFINATHINTFHEEMLLCEEILTVRKCLTNSEICDDWTSAVKCENGGNLCYLSVFPFRDSFYVTLYEVKKADEKEEVREVRSSSSQFVFEPKSVIEIEGKRYQIIESIVAKKSQQFLVHVLTWIRETIDELAKMKSAKFEDLEK